MMAIILDKFRIMQPFIISTLTIASAEMGDKTQILAFVLATRFKKPFAIIAGIFAASLLSNVLAGVIGTVLGHYLQGKVFDLILGITFLLAGIWMFFPDKDQAADIKHSKSSIFITTSLTFFIAELGDKTQLATAILAAKYQALWSVICGTTLGMMIANVPVVFLGSKAGQYIPIRFISFLAAAIFVTIGCFILARTFR